jgi:hypothetical protein
MHICFVIEEKQQDWIAEKWNVSDFKIFKIHHQQLFKKQQSN